MPSSPSSLRDKLLAALLGLAACLLLLELGLRLAGFSSQPLQPDASLRQQLVGDAQQVVLCVGDSMTYGIGSSTGGDFPTQLEELLNAADAPERPVAVVNAGIAGGNTTMILQALPGYLEVTAPDLLVLLAGTANLTNFYGFSRWRTAPGALAGLSDRLFQVRIFRFARLAMAFLRREELLDDRALLHGNAAALAAYVKWHQRRHHGRSPPEPFGEGARLLQLGAFRAAAERFEAGALAAPGRSCFPWGRGMAAWGLRQEAEAEAFFLRAAEAEPDDPNPHFALGEMLLRSDSERAGRSFEAGIAADPGFSGNHWGMAMVRQRGGQPGELLGSLQRCIASDPGDARCYAEFRQLSSQPEVFAQALAFLEEQAPRNPLARDTWSALQRSRQLAEIDAWTDHDLNAMVDLAAAADLPVLLQTYPSPNDPNQPLERLARSRDLPLVVHRPIFEQREAQGAGQLLLPDGHCSDAGYALMAANLARAIQELGLLSEPGGRAP